MKYYYREITDFRVIKSWQIENTSALKRLIIDYYRKSDFESFGKEWFWDRHDHFDRLLEQIEWFIGNTYVEVPNGYVKLFINK